MNQNNFFKELEETDDKNIINIDENIEKNIGFFIKLSSTIKFICYGFTILFVIACLFYFINGVPEFGIIYLIFAFLSAIIGYLSTPFLEWKSYTLRCLYDIRNNKKK